MLGKIALAAGLLTLGALVGPQISSAAPASSAAGLRGSDSGTVQQVHYRSCRYWRRECADRYGWGGYRYHRCLRRHGCGGWYD